MLDKAYDPKPVRRRGGSRPPHSATAVADGVTFFIPLAGVIDFAKERERLKETLAVLS